MPFCRIQYTNTRIVCNIHKHEGSPKRKKTITMLINILLLWLSFNTALVRIGIKQESRINNNVLTGIIIPVRTTVSNHFQFYCYYFSSQHKSASLQLISILSLFLFVYKWRSGVPWKRGRKNAFWINKKRKNSSCSPIRLCCCIIFQQTHNVDNNTCPHLSLPPHFF